MWFAVWPGVVTASMRPAVAGDDLAVGERAVGLEVGVVAGVEARRLADIERPRGAMRPFARAPRPPVAALIARHRGE